MAQDYTAWEAILVDDGSTDGSLALLETYQNKDKRFRVFAKNNGGVSSARNYGLTKVIGDWAFFLDADDCLKPNSLSLLLDKTDGVDSVFGGYVILNNNGELTYSISDHFEFALDKVQAIEQLFKPWHYRTLGAAWGKLFKIPVIRQYNLHFNERIHIGEDRLFVFEYLSKVNSVYYFTTPVYEYFERPGSAMDSFYKGKNKHFLTDLDAYLEMNRLTSAMPQKEKVLSLLKYGAKCNFHLLSDSYKPVGWRGLYIKVLSHWKLLRILSIRDYFRDILLPHILPQASDTV